MSRAIRRAAAFENTRDNEQLQGLSIDEYTEGVRIMDEDETEQYFKAQALENAQAQALEPLQGEILSAKVCKNSNIMLFVKLPDGEKKNLFLTVAEVQALGIALAIVPIYNTTPKGVKVITGYEVANDAEQLKALFYGKHCTIARMVNYTITEIW